MSECLSSGTPLKNYVIERVLGRGAFGITYLARDQDLEHQVAIKEYLPQDFATRVQDNTVIPLEGEKGELFNYGLNSFLNEAKTIAKFRHPNIVRVIAFFRENNTAYIVMEYEKGKTLKQYIKEVGRTNQTMLLNVICPIVQGLVEVHKHGYIHRDIKPDNIVVREDNTPVLIDFGTARDTMNVKSEELTQIFTNGYAPYEQCNPLWEKQGPWTDIYSLGVTMYYLMTGNRVENAQHRFVLDTHTPLKEDEHSEYSPFLLQAINKSVAFHPSDRPQTLNQWLSGVCQLKFQRVVVAEDEPTVVHNEPPHSFHPHRACEAYAEHMGRGTLVQHMFGRLGTDDVQSFAVIGFVKSGKSSLLNFIKCNETLAHYLKEKKDIYRFIYLDIDERNIKTESDFFDELYRLAAELYSDEVYEPLTMEKISGIVNDRGERLVVMLDNFNKIITNHNFKVHFYESLRSWFSTCSGIGCIVSSPVQLLHLAVPMELSGSPFFNIFGTYNLNAFSDQEAAEFLISRLPYPLRERETDIQMVLHDVGNSPYELHVVGNSWLTGYEISGNEAYEDVRENVFDCLSTHYQKIYDSFSRKQLVIMHSLVNEGDNSSIRFDPELVDRGWVTKDRKAIKPFFMQRYIHELPVCDLHKKVGKFHRIKQFLEKVWQGKGLHQ